MFLSLLSLSCLLLVSSACYIQNCPRGGKRGLTEDHGLRECMSCGASGRGRCFGPNICCTEGEGCEVATPESSHCVEENYLMTPCQSGGRPCGAAGGRQGRCAGPRLCCDSESCALDSSCSGEEAPGQTRGGSPGELLLRLLHVTSRVQSEY